MPFLYFYFCCCYLHVAATQGPNFRFCSGQPSANPLEKEGFIFCIKPAVSSPVGGPRDFRFLCPLHIHEIHKMF
ncbi:hypothetical protein XELAEV_18032224mg [Xenopus laevis]|uniref:Secreted protein n=1 Tax=Xenopus laevis TaxID=8355 RepID=A0A974CRE1_XENLA|nr:hypothetical protein XELAEV_18032224mg [Xenopus laevis]